MEEDIFRAVCQYCLSEQGMVTVEIPISEYEGGYKTQKHTVEITQCMNCKMIQQPKED